MKNTQAMIFCLLIINLWSCKKYEEGPFLSLRSAEKRIVGEWQIDSYTVDGADSMAVINEVGLQGRFRFGEYFNTTEAALTIETNTSTIRSYYTGEWSFENEYNELYFYIDSSLKFDLKRVPLRSTWKIMKLTYKKDLWLSLDEDGKRYELKFKPL